MGFQHARSGASILVAELAGPAGEVIAGVTDEAIASQGVQVSARTDLTVDGRPGLLIEGLQRNQDLVFGKLILVTGTQDLTVLVTGNFLVDDVARGDAIRAAILALTFDPNVSTDPQSALSFTIAPAPPLRYAGVFGNGAMYNPSGSVPAAADEPYLLVAPSLGDLVTGDLSEFARQSLMSTATLTDIVIESSSDISVAGLKGIVLTATATRTTRGDPVVVYHVVLSDGSGYVRMIGISPVAKGASFVDVFRQTVESYRPRS
jgi:hypothetical protein